MAGGRSQLRRGALMAAARGLCTCPPPCCPLATGPDRGRGATRRSAASPSTWCGRCGSRRGGSAGADRPCRGSPAAAATAPGAARERWGRPCPGVGFPGGDLNASPCLASPLWSCPCPRGCAAPAHGCAPFPGYKLIFFIASLRSLLFK